MRAVPRLDGEIRRARAGDPRAFRLLTEELGPDLTRFVTYFLRGDLHAANDVVQDTFVEAWRKLARIGTEEHLRPWLYHVAKCKAISWLRRRAPPGARFEALDVVREGHIELASRGKPPAPPSGPRPGERGELSRALRDAVTALPAAYAAVVELHYLHGLDTRETARVLDLPRTTVKMRLHRARKSLRLALDREYP